jgi:hypothetical protein
MQKFLILGLLFFGFAGSAFSQCRTADREVRKPIKVTRGAAITVRDTVRLCTSHTYRFRASRGERLDIRLTTGSKTSMTVLPPSGEAIVDGDLSWKGRLTDTGEYEVQIGTDATAEYSLRVLIMPR